MTPIAPDDPMPEAGRKILLLNLVDMLDHHEKLGGDNMTHHVHQMRVATRRIRSALRVFGEYYQDRLIKPILKGLRSSARALGTVRDLDVLLDNMHTYQKELEGEAAAAFTPLFEELESERQEARDDLLKWLGSKAYARFLKKFITFATTAGLGAIAPDGETTPYEVRHVVPVILHQQLAQVRAFDGHLTDAPYERLHALRIEFKRLRYLLTFFVENLGASAADFVDEIKVMQEHLGRLNDAVVALERLSDRDVFSPEQLEALAPYRQTLDEKQAQLTTDFGDLWAHFNTRTVQRKLSDALLVAR
jgi:CHAD domain-containing protein